MTSYYMSSAGRKNLVFSHLFLLLYPSSSTKEFLVPRADIQRLRTYVRCYLKEEAHT